MHETFRKARNFRGLLRARRTAGLTSTAGPIDAIGPPLPGRPGSTLATRPSLWSRGLAEIMKQRGKLSSLGGLVAADPAGLAVSSTDREHLVTTG